MKEDFHQRRNTRLPDYDYTQAGLYFVTICTKDRKNLFGKIYNSIMELNNYGNIVEEELLLTETLRNYIKIDSYVIMPNHLHFVLQIFDAEDEITDARQNVKKGTITDAARCVPTENDGKILPRSLSAIVRAIKSAITKRINEIRNTPGDSIWQRRFYEHVIRNEHSLNDIRNYIENNPSNWLKDSLYDI